MHSLRVSITSSQGFDMRFVSIIAHANGVCQQPRRQGQPTTPVMSSFRHPRSRRLCCFLACQDNFSVMFPSTRTRLPGRLYACRIPVGLRIALPDSAFYSVGAALYFSVEDRNSSSCCRCSSSAESPLCSILLCFFSRCCILSASTHTSKVSAADIPPAAF